MANRSASTPRDAGNKPGSSPAVACDWHRGVADFHLGTGHTAPTSDAGYTTASDFRLARTSITPYLREESIYGLLGNALKAVISTHSQIVDLGLAEKLE
jgi:hypothetical protein